MTDKIQPEKTKIKESKKNSKLIRKEKNNTGIDKTETIVSFLELPNKQKMNGTKNK